LGAPVRVSFPQPDSLKHVPAPMERERFSNLVLAGQWKDHR
jgi:hypothetical protein